MRDLVRLVVVALALALCAGSSTKNKEPVSASEPALDVTATALGKAYSDNEVAADQTYKGKVVRVAGVITAISKQVIGDGMYVVLQGGTTDVQCFFAASQESSLATLKRGKRVTLRGRVDGKMLNVTVQGCSVE